MARARRALAAPGAGARPPADADAETAARRRRRRRHRAGRGGPRAAPEHVRPENGRTALHPQRLRRLRRQEDRRDLPPDARQPRPAQRRRQRAEKRPVRVLVIRQDADGGVRQLGRQYHVRGGRQSEHGTQRGAAADGSAARRAVPGGSRPVDRRRQDLRQRRVGSVHRDVVQRARVRFGRQRHGAGHAAARRHDRDEIRDGRARRRGRGALAGTHRRVQAGQPQRHRADGERFAASPQLDTVALAQKFYRSHSDSYDQLILWTDTSVTTSGTFAYELTVANEVRGIGIDIFDASEDFGSTGRRLRSLVVMDALNKYPDDPAAKFLGENNTLSLLGQESGHRWLAFLEFKDHDGQRSDALLGRDLVHWSFFMNSDASVMEGNAIQDLGGGSFVTTAAVQRYSLLDQYAMGLVPDTEVPTFFYVESPVNVTPSRTRSSAPQVGVTFSGTRRDVLIKDVTDGMGPRIPSAADSPRTHRHAFIYLVSAGRSADTGLIAKIDRIRKAWEPFFMQATDQRMTLITRLQ